MMRRVLALGLGLLLMAHFFAVPVAPSLVCRYTGEPMALVVATSKTHASCCAVAVSTGAEGERGYALTSPGCCELRSHPAHSTPTAALSAPGLPATIAWAPSPAVLYVPPLREAAAPYAVCSQTAPRGPPLASSPPRAPPFLS